METFNPLRHVVNASAILDENGDWPNFHDANVNEFHYDRGDIRPDDDVWEGAVVEVALTLTVYREPYDVRLRFRDCGDVRLGIDGHVKPPDIYDLTFAFEGRGTLMDGITPLTPWICVTFQHSAGIALALKCFRVEAERSPGPPRRY